MRAMYLPMRMAGWRLSFMIDDALTLWRRMVDACLGASVFVRILCSLGCHLSLRKCRLGPNPAVRYEGMMLDLAQGAVLIPADKLQGFDDLVHSLITSDHFSRRQLARLAGLLVSFQCAVPLGRLFTHTLFGALTGVCDWDSLFTPSAELREFLAWLREYVPAHNGRRWWSRSAAAVLVSDASATGAGGAAVVTTAPTVRVSLAAELPRELHLQSSGCREVGAMVQLVDTLLSIPAWRDHLQHGRLHILSDSQVAVRDVQNMRGPEPIYQQVRLLYERLAAHDIDLTIEWRPREDPRLQYADHLSKCEDVGDWAVAPPVFAHLLSVLGCPAPSVDWFAAPWSAKAPRFYTRFPVAGAAGADAFDACWLLEPGQLGLICPPHTIISRVLAKVIADRASCILILPAWWAVWSGQLQLLPVKAKHKLPGTCLLWGPRAPPPDRRCAALSAGLWAYLVQYE
jgi:hypothetical protein